MAPGTYAISAACMAPTSIINQLVKPFPPDPATSSKSASSASNWPNKRNTYGEANTTEHNKKISLARTRTLHLPQSRSNTSASCMPSQRHRCLNGTAHRPKPRARKPLPGHPPAHLGRRWSRHLPHYALRTAQNRVAKKHLLSLGHSRHLYGWHHPRPLIACEPE